MIARRLGLPPERCELIRIASPLHDIGKIKVPDRILVTPDPLTPEDWEIVREHPETGYKMLAGSGQELLELAATIALTHHERVDGSGYPRGLRGDEIPIEGRIAAVADVFDALTIDRVYQPARPVEEAHARSSRRAATPTSRQTSSTRSTRVSRRMPRLAGRPCWRTPAGIPGQCQNRGRAGRTPQI